MVQKCNNCWFTINSDREWLECKNGEWKTCWLFIKKEYNPLVR